MKLRVHILCLNLQQPKTVSDPPRFQDLVVINYQVGELTEQEGELWVYNPLLPSGPLALLIFSHEFEIQIIKGNCTPPHLKFIATVLLQNWGQ